MWDAIVAPIVGTTNGATAVNLDSDDIDSDELGLITYASLFNESGESVTVEFVVMRGTQELQLGPKQVVQTEDAAHITPWLFLGVGEFFRAVVTGAANSSKVSLRLSGITFKPADWPFPRMPAGA